MTLFNRLRCWYYEDSLSNETSPLSFNLFSISLCIFLSSYLPSIPLSSYLFWSLVLSLFLIISLLISLYLSFYLSLFSPRFLFLHLSSYHFFYLALPISFYPSLYLSLSLYLFLSFFIRLSPLSLFLSLSSSFYLFFHPSIDSVYQKDICPIILIEYLFIIVSEILSSRHSAQAFILLERKKMRWGRH